MKPLLSILLSVLTRMRLALAMLVILAAALFPATVIAAPGDDKFLAAREAYRVGEPARLSRMVEALRGHDLEPWAEYWQQELLLTPQSSQGSSDGIEAFLASNKGTYLAERLRSDWLKILGRRAAWTDFIAQYSSLQEPDTELVCYFWQARIALNNTGENTINDARNLWLASAGLPESCTPVMDHLIGEKQLSTSDIWVRVRNMLEQSKYAEAQAAARYLPARQMPDTKTLERIAAKPAYYLDHLPAANNVNTRQSNETTMFAVLRQARKDTADAARRWQQIESRFDADERSYVWGQLARQAARMHMNEALTWYESADNATLSDDQQAWRVRAALRVMNWPAVLHAIELMPATLAARPDWVYWRARAMTAMGNKEEALTLYQGICSLPGFYGVLAAEELGLPLNLPPRATAPTTEELDRAAANPGLRQALALFRLDMRTEGVRTWNWTVRSMNDRDLLAAAELARRNDVFDRTISTAERTLAEHDYSLRYLAPYRDAISPKAQALALDDSWVYGLMRQESRFVTSARSGVGARGLMQVMPSTAKLVARKIGLLGYKPGHVDDMATNVTLGTNYLKMVLGSLDNHPVLACTAYNAGPGRAQRWRSDQPLEGAIYAETIPFSETRDYVKKVMANSVYYSALFEEKPQTLKSRLGVVQPRPGVDIIKSVEPDSEGTEP
jgi:soluble lytic murein transglycosylase